MLSCTGLVHIVCTRCTLSLVAAPTVGAHTVGAHTVGAHTVGAHTVGAHTVGAHTVGAYSWCTHSWCLVVVKCSAWCMPGLNRSQKHSWRAI